MSISFDIVLHRLTSFDTAGICDFQAAKDIVWHRLTSFDIVWHGWNLWFPSRQGHRLTSFDIVRSFSSLESCILCVISSEWNADFIHSEGPCRTIYRGPSQPCVMDENHVSAATRQKSRKCSEDAGGRPREKRRHDHFNAWIMHPVRHLERVKCWLYSFKGAMSVDLQMSFSAMFNGRKPRLRGDATREQEMLWGRWGAPEGEEASQIRPKSVRFGTDLGRLFFPSTWRSWPFHHLNHSSCASFRTCEMLTLFTQGGHVGQFTDALLCHV